MVTKICWTIVALCCVLVAGQFSLTAYWSSQLSKSYYYTLVGEFLSNTDKISMADGRELVVPEGFKVTSWPRNGHHGWKLSLDDQSISSGASLTVYLDYFETPLMLVSGMSDEGNELHCRALDELMACSGKTGKDWYINDFSDSMHACRAVLGSFQENDDSYHEFIYFGVPDRPETLFVRGPRGSGESFLYLIQHLLDGLSTQPSEEFLLACLGRGLLEL